MVFICTREVISLDIDVFLQASEILFDVARQFDNLEFIDFGSGFKVPYKDNDYRNQY